MEYDQHSSKQENDETQTSNLNIKSEAKITAGWNDPPNITFTPTNNMKRFKRPVYVVPNATVSSNAIKPLENLPSVKPSSTNVPDSSILYSCSESKSELLDDEKLEQILNHFNDILKKHKLSDKNMTKRLKIIEDMWKNKKFTMSINSSLWKISEALRTNDIETAEKLHVALMTESPGLCSSWMPAIRCIINLYSIQKNI